MLEVLSKNLEDLDIVANFRYLMYEEIFDSAGNFNLYCDINDRNMSILQEDNIILFEDGVCGIIKEIQKTKDESQNDNCLSISGKTCEYLLFSRVIWGQYIKNNSVTNIIKDLLNKNVLSPTIQQRKISFLNYSEIDFVDNTNIAYQNTGGNLYDEICNLCQGYNLGFNILFDKSTNKFLFKIAKGIDRTINQDLVDPIIFSSENGNIESCEYVKNTLDYKNVALVAGEGEGANRTYLSVEATSELSGIDRKELFVDARDLQKKDENNEPISDTEYKNMLKSRGIEKLNENKIVENFNVGSIIENKYIYGIDFNLGDIVTVYDDELKIGANVVVKGVQHLYENYSYNTNSLILGEIKPSIYDKIRRASK